MTRRIARGAAVAFAVVTAVAVAGPAYAVEPVDTVVKTVQNTVGGRVPGTGPVTGAPARARSAVVGYVAIGWAGDTAGPSYTLAGALADPTQWACTDNGGTTTYSVTCLPVPLVLPVEYHCDVLHADLLGLSTAAAGRTSLDCDSDGVAEARTRAVSGVDSDGVYAVDTRLVTAFTCTVDGGHPDYQGGCGDPGLVGIA
ncbi:MAG TPA: hypothetical protein VF519_03240 [Mycobacteriales bacterium]